MERHPSGARLPAIRLPAADEIVLTLGDVLSRIPTDYLTPGSHDAKRELRFKINDLSSDIARGRAAVPLSRIAQLVPDIFIKEISPEEDAEVRLPLQKLVEQIGLLRSQSKSPTVEKGPRPVLPAGEAGPAGRPVVDIEARKEVLRDAAAAPASPSVSIPPRQPMGQPQQPPPIILSEPAPAPRVVELRASAEQVAPVILGPPAAAEPPPVVATPVVPAPVTPEPVAATAFAEKTFSPVDLPPSPSPEAVAPAVPVTSATPLAPVVLPEPTGPVASAAPTATETPPATATPAPSVPEPRPAVFLVSPAATEPVAPVAAPSRMVFDWAAGAAAIAEPARESSAAEKTVESLPPSVPEAVAQPLVASLPETVQEPLAPDVSESVAEPLDPTKAETVRESFSARVCQTASEPWDATTAETIREPLPASIPETVREPSAASIPEPVTEPLVASISETTAEPSPANTPEAVFEPFDATTAETIREPLPASIPETVREPLAARIAESLPMEPAAAAPKLAPVESPALEPGEEKIQLSLAAILRHCPPEIIVGQLPHVDDSVRITLPVAPIDRQLIKGQVEVSSLRFVVALPEIYQKYFVAKVGVKVPIPLEEVFQNLPSPVHELTPVNPVPPPHVLAPAPAAAVAPVVPEPVAVIPEPAAVVPEPAVPAPEIPTVNEKSSDEASKVETPAESLPPAEKPRSTGLFTSILETVSAFSAFTSIRPSAKVVEPAAPVEPSVAPVVEPPVAVAPTAPPEAPEASAPVLPPPLPPMAGPAPAASGDAAVIPPSEAAVVTPSQELTPAAPSEPAPETTASSEETPKLVLQPQSFRPFFVLPPPIFGFAPPPADAPESEPPARVEPPSLLSSLTEAAPQNVAATESAPAAASAEPAESGTTTEPVALAVAGTCTVAHFGRRPIVGCGTSGKRPSRRVPNPRPPRR